MKTSNLESAQCFDRGALGLWPKCIKPANKKDTYSYTMLMEISENIFIPLRRPHRGTPRRVHVGAAGRATFRK